MGRLPALVAVAVLAACTTTSGSPSSPVVSAGSASSSVSTPPSPTPVAPNSVGVPHPGDMVSAFDSIWVQGRSDGSIWRIGRTGKVEAQIPDASFVGPGARFGAPTVGLGAGFGSIWSLTDDALVRIDPTSNHVIGRLPIRTPFALAVGEGAVWAICCEAQVTIKRIDPSTMRVETFVHVGTSMKAFGVGDGYLWAIEFSEGGGIYRIDPATAHVDDLRVGYNERFILPTPRWVWLIDGGSAQRIDPSTGTLVDARAKMKAPGSIGVAYSQGTVWLNAGTAVGFDATSGKVTARIPGFTGIKWWWTGGIAKLGHRVWVADPKGDQLLSLPLD